MVYYRSEKGVWCGCVEDNQRWMELKDRTGFKVGVNNRMKFWIDKWYGHTCPRDSFPAFYSIASSKDAWVDDV